MCYCFAFVVQLLISRFSYFYQGADTSRLLSLSDSSSDFIPGDPLSTISSFRALETFFTNQQLMSAGLEIGSVLQTLFFQVLVKPTTEIERLELRIALTNDTMLEAFCYSTDESNAQDLVLVAAQSVVLSSSYEGMWLRVDITNDSPLLYYGESLILQIVANSVIAPMMQGRLAFYPSPEVRRTCTTVMLSGNRLAHEFHQYALAVRLGHFGDPPTVESVTPSFGSSDGGTLITIGGRGFGNIPSNLVRVLIGRNACIGHRLLNDSFVECITPSNTYFSRSAVILETLDSGRMHSPDEVLFTYAQPPRILSFHPWFAPLSGGITVMIYGTNFATNTADLLAVSVAGVACSEVSVIDSETIRCVSGTSAQSKVGPVMVQSKSGGTGYGEVKFTYMPEHEVVVDPVQGDDTSCSPCRSLEGATLALSMRYTHFLLKAGFYTISSLAFLSDGCTLEALEGPETTSLQCVGQCFDFSGFVPSLISGFSITQASTLSSRYLASEGGVFALRTHPLESPLSFKNCHFSSLTADNGAVAYVLSASVVFLNCTVVSASITGDGGVFYVESGSISFIDTIVSSSIAPSGAVVYMKSSAFVSQRSKFHDNSALGTIYGANSDLTIVSSDFFNNFGLSNGAAISLIEGTLDISLSFFRNNTVSKAEFGGALFLQLVQTRLNNTLFESNRALMGRGGAICSVFGTIQIHFCSFQLNSAISGGALYLKSLTNSLFSSSSFVWNFAALPSPTNTVARGGAGYLFDCSYHEETNCTYDSNVAQVGGGLYLDMCGDADSYIQQVEFAHNNGTMGGGAMYISDSMLSINGTLFDSNHAMEGGGGGVLHDNAAHVSMNTDAIFSNNLALYGSSLASQPASLLVKQNGSVVAGLDSPVMANSNHAIEPPLIVSVLDSYGNVVRSMSYSVVQFRGDLRVSSGIGTVLQSVVDGFANFSGFGIHAMPNATYSFSFVLPVVGFATSIQTQLAIQLRGCSLQEYLDNSECLPCPSHTIRAENDTTLLLDSCVCFEGTRTGFVPPCGFTLPRYQWQIPQSRILAFAVLFAAIIVLCVAILIWVFHHRDHEAISSSYRLCYLLVFGCMFALACPVIGTSDPTPVKCVLAPIFGAVAFAVTFGALLAKNYRFYRAIYVDTEIDYHVRDTDIAKLIAIILMPEALAIALFYSLHKSEILQVDIIGDSSLYASTCSHTVTFYYHMTSYLIKGIVLLCGVYLCVKVRMLPEKYNENKWISAIIYNVTFLGGFFVLLFALIKNQPVSQLAVYGGAVIFLVCSTLCLFFIPKYIAVRWPNFFRNQNKLDSMGNTKWTSWEQDRKLQADAMAMVRIRATRATTKVAPLNETSGAKPSIGAPSNEATGAKATSYAGPSICTSTTDQKLLRISRPTSHSSNNPLPKLVVRGKHSNPILLSAPLQAIPPSIPLQDLKKPSDGSKLNDIFVPKDILATHNAAKESSS